MDFLLQRKYLALATLFLSLSTHAYPASFYAAPQPVFKDTAAICHSSSDLLSIRAQDAIDKRRDSATHITAAQAATAMKRLASLKETSDKELFEIALFIQTKLTHETLTGKRYFPRNETRLARDIEFDPESKRIFIHLDDQILGKGYFKVVSKTVSYDPVKPEILARSVQPGKMGKEFLITKDLSGSGGVVETLAFTRNKINGKTTSVIIGKLYNSGSLDSVLRKKTRFTVREKVTMVLNMLKGLESMHKKGYTHNDLGPRNHLVDITNNRVTKERIVTCVLCDFGRSFACAKTKGKRAQGNKLYFAPEAIMVEKLSGDDYKATDVFALGCTFHKLLTRKLFPWQQARYVYEGRRGPDQYAKNTLTLLIRKHTEQERERLIKKQKSGTLTSKEAIDLVVLKMVHHDAASRPTATELREEVEKIYNTL